MIKLTNGGYIWLSVFHRGPFFARDQMGERMESWESHVYGMNKQTWNITVVSWWFLLMLSPLLGACVQKVYTEREYDWQVWVDSKTIQAKSVANE